MYFSTDLNILLRLNTYQLTILYRVQEQNSFHSTISLAHRLQFDERRITHNETAKKRQGHSHTSRGQRTCYCRYGQEGLYQQNGLTMLVNDKHTDEPLRRGPTPALQRRLTGKLLDVKMTETIDIHPYYRLRCRVPQSAKHYGLPKLHKPNIPMRPIVSFCGSARWSLETRVWPVVPEFQLRSRERFQYKVPARILGQIFQVSSQDCGIVLSVLLFDRSFPSWGRPSGLTLWFCPVGSLLFLQLFCWSHHVK